MKRELSRKINLQFFAEHIDPPADPPKGDDPKDPPADPPKTFTQEDLDKIVADRIARERKKFGDYDDVKTKLAEFTKADEERKKAEMDIQDRLKLEKEEAEKLAKEKEDFANQALEKANARLVKAEFRLIAKELGVRADALEDAFVLTDKTSIKVDDEGTVEGVKEAVEALIKAKPFLAEPVKKEPKQIGNASNPPADGTQKTSEQLLKEAADKAKRTGRMEDRMAYAQLKRELGL